jgi:tetratricopeptide (TPR) repeat protein
MSDFLGGTVNKLSICVIVGNESIHIERFLKSFSKIADEFVLVRAIGSAVPDDTLSKCGGIGVPMRIGEYHNAIDERKGWLHVDDFGAARQESFDLASSDWLMWADIDDVWPETEKNADLIEKLKTGELDQYAYIHIDYQVPDAKAMVPRERFVKRKASPKWHNPIHEYFSVEGSRAYLIGPSIIHSPLVEKKTSAERNLRILEFATGRPDLYPDQATLWFYKHRELMYLGKPKESMEAAEKALPLLQSTAVESDEDSQDAHKLLLYEILIVTAEICILKGDPSGARARAHGAVNVMPGRREAYAVLIQIEHQQRNYRKMLAYASAMRGIPEPTGINRSWTQRDLLYSWHGAFLYHQALRLNGQIERAEQEEEAVFQMEGATVTVIHPTMLRTDLAVQTYGKFMAAASNPGAVQYIFAIDDADDYSKDVLRPYKTVICPRGAFQAVEYAKKFATGKRIQVIDDYAEPKKRWDAEGKFSVIGAARPWKLEAPWNGYSKIITKESPRYIICAKEGKSENHDFQPQHCHYELGWEQGTSHVYAKWLLSQGKLMKDAVIVTLPGRQFLYQTCFDRVITWEDFCKETGLKYGTPYQDASNVRTLDLVEYFERNWHRYDDVYFTGKGQTWNGGAWDLIQNVKSPLLMPTAYGFDGENIVGDGRFLLLSLRKRPHESRRDTPDEFGKELLQKLREGLGLPIFLVGLNLPDFGVEGVRGCCLQEFAALMLSPLCVGILGPHSGPNGLAGLLAPKGKDIIIFPMEYCPSINSNYPSGMGKCLNLNGNIRHWLPVGSRPDDIVAKAREVLPCPS